MTHINKIDTGVYDVNGIEVNEDNYKEKLKKYPGDLKSFSNYLECLGKLKIKSSIVK